VGSERIAETVPTYEYACRSCGEHLEVVQSFADDALTTCPACGGKLRKVFGAIGVSFKGSGFYRTDSRDGGRAREGKKPEAAKPEAAKPEAAKPGAAKPGAAKAESKESAKSPESASSSSGATAPAAS